MSSIEASYKPLNDNSSNERIVLVSKEVALQIENFDPSVIQDRKSDCDIYQLHLTKSAYESLRDLFRKKILSGKPDFARRKHMTPNALADGMTKLRERFEVANRQVGNPQIFPVVDFPNKGTRHRLRLVK